ncbi:MAG TPA: hypothetical protein VJ201_00230 [Candidatus Babeliales bacterium]|nr:hypothetical protein [Candidatus Babeliales bacterium]
MYKIFQSSKRDNHKGFTNDIVDKYAQPSSGSGIKAPMCQRLFFVV